MENINIVTIQDNEKEFLEEKEKLYEEAVPKAEKKMTGWGSWTGKGVQEVKADPKIELERKKREIMLLKRKRQDGNLNHVIINESR